METPATQTGSTKQREGKCTPASITEEFLATQNSPKQEYIAQMSANNDDGDGRQYGR